MNWSHNDLTDDHFRHDRITQCSLCQTICWILSAQKLNAGSNISLFFNLAKLTKHTCSLSAVVVTSLSASNPNHPLPATWELPSIIRAFYCWPLSSCRAQESCLRSFLIESSHLQHPNQWNVHIVRPQFWFCKLKDGAVNSFTTVKQNQYQNTKHCID